MNDHMKQRSNEHYCVFHVLQWTPIKNKWPKKYDWIQSCYIIFDIIYTCIYPYRVPFFINDIYYLIEYIEDIHFCVVFLCCVPIQISHGPAMYPSNLESSSAFKMVTWGISADKLTTLACSMWQASHDLP